MASHTSVERGLDRGETSASTALHQLGAHLATDPEWIAAVSREIAEAVLREFPQLREDAELRATTRTGAESNVRQLIEILRREQGRARRRAADGDRARLRVRAQGRPG